MSLRIESGRHRRHDTGHRRQSLWTVAMIHRLSGILLALFLPLHFLALGLAIEGEARLQSFLLWSHQPLVKFAESGLVALLVVHFLGGLRLLLIENLPWHGSYKTMAMVAVALAMAAGFVFLLNAG